MNSIKFTSKVTIPITEFNITHNEPLLLIGSCFSQNIGSKLVDHKFNVEINPFGIIYNPISIANALEKITDNKYISDSELNQSPSGKWFSFQHHGDFSAQNKQECLAKINSSINKSHFHLIKSNTIIVTFGTAWVYNHIENGIVANCHKVPAKEFSKQLLDVERIVKTYETLLSGLKTHNPTLKIIFTVSPVRHVKDGLYENNLSKSVLHLAIKKIVEQHDNCSYFPAYEIVIDELRDYRFFKEDLVHPTALAIDYVWEKFISVYCDEETKKLIEVLYKLKQAITHKPFNFKSSEHQNFIAKQIEIMVQLSKKYPFFNFENDIASLKQD